MKETQQQQPHQQQLLTNTQQPQQPQIQQPHQPLQPPIQKTQQQQQTGNKDNTQDFSTLNKDLALSDDDTNTNDTAAQTDTPLDELLKGIPTKVENRSDFIRIAQTLGSSIYKTLANPASLALIHSLSAISKLAEKISGKPDSGLLDATDTILSQPFFEQAVKDHQEANPNPADILNIALTQADLETLAVLPNTTLR